MKKLILLLTIIAMSIPSIADTTSTAGDSPMKFKIDTTHQAAVITDTIHGIDPTVLQQITDTMQFLPVSVLGWHTTAGTLVLIALGLLEGISRLIPGVKPFSQWAHEKLNRK